MDHRVQLLLFVAIVAPGCDGNGTLPPEREPFVGADGEPLACTPNLDGQIDADEIITALGLEVSYLVSPPGASREVDIGGDASDGDIVWDWSIDLADDQLARLGPETIDGRWYAERFPSDAFVAPFDGGGTIETISRQSDDTLWLLGLASAQADPPEGRTLLVYDEPVAILTFPIVPGSTHTSVGIIDNATFRGIPYAATDTYEVSVDAIGSLLVPSFTFTQAHRVRQLLTVEPVLGDPQTVRQVSFFFECFGEIARATSHPGEPDPDFTEAASVRRIGY